MGYRLEISKIEYRACGGKLYGYEGSSVEELLYYDLKSVRWLLDNNFIDEDNYWCYGNSNQIVLDKDEYKEFIKLYAEDMKEHYKYGDEFNINELLKDAFELTEEDGDKLIEWI